MSFFNMTALSVMLKPMFPAVFARVDQMEQDGTLDKVNDLVTTLANNGTFEALKELAVKIDHHNKLLEEIRDRLPPVTFAPSGVTGHDGAEPLGLPEPAGAD